MRELLRFSFLVSFVILLILLFVEWKIPGFVSYVFPMYLIFALVMVLGIATAALSNSTPSVSPVSGGVTPSNGVLTASDVGSPPVKEACPSGRRGLGEVRAGVRTEAVIALLIGLALAEIIAKDGAVFGFMQAPFALICFVAPAVLVWYHNLEPRI